VLVFCGALFAHFGWFSQDMRLSTVVAGFFRSNSLQPRLCRFFTLGAWPTHDRGVSPWTGACGSWLVFQGAVVGFEVVSRSSDEFLLQRRSPVERHGLATAPPNAGLDVGFCFRVFMFFSNVFTICLCNA
jgi:hypothetical protein